MENLGKSGFHASACAGCEDDDSCGRIMCHGKVLLVSGAMNPVLDRSATRTRTWNTRTKNWGVADYTIADGPKGAGDKPSPSSRESENGTRLGVRKCCTCLIHAPLALALPG